MVRPVDSSFPFRSVVLVADVFEEGASNEPVHKRRDLEKTDGDTLEAVSAAIRALGLKVHHYTGPKRLAESAARHKQDIVLAIYGGEDSRNRMALVPAVCETFDLPFIGPDVYGRVIAQDKEISKRLAIESGLRTPPWRVARDERDLALLGELNAPVVVKPLLEGSSIGISGRNLVARPDEVLPVARELLATFRQPVIIEEFVSGREVAYARIQDGSETSWAFSEILLPDNPQYFNDHLFDAQEKQFRAPGRTVRNIDQELGDGDRAKIEAFLRAFGRFGYCRVDGRLSASGFNFLEMTPDAWLAPTGQFAMSFANRGWTYKDVIASVLLSGR